MCSPISSTPLSYDDLILSPDRPSEKLSCMPSRRPIVYHLDVLSTQYSNDCFETQEFLPELDQNGKEVWERIPDVRFTVDGNFGQFHFPSNGEVPLAQARWFVHKFSQSVQDCDKSRIQILERRCFYFLSKLKIYGASEKDLISLKVRYSECYKPFLSTDEGTLREKQICEAMRSILFKTIKRKEKAILAKKRAEKRFI